MTLCIEFRLLQHTFPCFHGLTHAEIIVHTHGLLMFRHFELGSDPFEWVPMLLCSHLVVLQLASVIVVHAFVILCFSRVVPVAPFEQVILSIAVRLQLIVLVLFFSLPLRLWMITHVRLTGPNPIDPPLLLDLAKVRMR